MRRCSTTRASPKAGKLKRPQFCKGADLSVLQGVFSVLPTPFLDNGDLDLASMGRVIDLFVAGGVNGVTALGVTGEIARLTDVERQTVLEAVMEHVNGRVAVVAGT